MTHIPAGARRVGRWAPLVALLALAAPPAAGQPAEPVVGLLPLSSVFGDDACVPARRAGVVLYRAASSSSEAIGRIEPPASSPGQASGYCDLRQSVVRLRSAPSGDASVAELPTLESDYEIPAAVVYERAGRWFRIALSSGSAWLECDGENVVSYPESLATGQLLAYLRPGWDGRLWSVPGGNSARAAPAAWRRLGERELPVTVVRTERREGRPWIHVRFKTESCGEVLGALPALEGWLPAHRTSNETSVWFYSRGC